MPFSDAIGNARSRRGADIANEEQRDGFWPLAAAAYYAATH